MKLAWMALTGMIAAAASTAAVAADQPKPVWSIDLVDVKDGELENYVSYLQQNWEVVREKAVAQHLILSYKMILLNKKPTAFGNADVLMLTEYPSADAYNRAEELFEPIRKSRTLVKINGKTSKDFVQAMHSFSGY